ncbi:hypothetical protein Deia_00016 [Candidatus Deianiraea vastatrix]|uniref:Uncharacterized protein n=1 Tax=Candidatus Deianiraea vastatrix TaxID=2163644 RepID=A0A5B8XC34_9RICK|nr:hypothetical protein Deia_00016 [Candidatus Deianiraea vastatrix]
MVLKGGKGGSVEGEEEYQLVIINLATKKAK